MKISLSRKGFDSEFGRHPSPILPDGRMISLPIPNDKESLSYSNLKLEDNKTYYDLMKELGISKKDARCHLDPDIRIDVLKRDDEWAQTLGHIGSSQAHLENQGVKEGDVFLFFGWFRKTIYSNGKLLFNPKEKRGIHVIFGYLQIGKKINANLIFKPPKWMKYHPHMIDERRKIPTNMLYVARKTLSWNSNIPGAGVFKFDRSLVLTKEGQTRSHWGLPSLFRNAKISYHNASCWKDGYFSSRGRGQEFVIDDGKVETWAKNLIETNFN